MTKDVFYNSIIFSLCTDTQCEKGYTFFGRESFFLLFYASEKLSLPLVRSKNSLTWIIYIILWTKARVAKKRFKVHKVRYSDVQPWNKKKSENKNSKMEFRK